MTAEKRIGFFVAGGVALVIIALLLAWVAVSGLGEKVIISQQATAETAVETETQMVARVLDGDTIELSDRRRVRYIGVSAAEIASHGKPAQCYASEAKAENERLVLNKNVRLEKDTGNRDKYGRLLRYVYAEGGREEVFVNDYLIRYGFARVLNIPPDLKFERQFNASLDEARFQNRGLWGVCY